MDQIVGILKLLRWKTKVQTFHKEFLFSIGNNFSVLAYESKKYLLEIKESLEIMRDKPSLNTNINFAPLHLFDKVS